VLLEDTELAVTDGGRKDSYTEFSSCVWPGSLTTLLSPISTSNTQVSITARGLSGNLLLLLEEEIMVNFLYYNYFYIMIKFLKRVLEHKIMAAGCLSAYPP